MGNTKYLFLSIIISFFVIGCNKKIDNVREFEQLINSDNSSYVKIHERKSIKYTLRYLPTDALLLRDYKRLEELKLDPKPNNAEIKKLLNEIAEQKKAYSNSIYFNLTLGYTDDKKDIEYERMSKGFNVYSQWLNKLLFSMNEYIWIETPAIEEVPLGIYQMDRTFGMTKDRSFLLCFPAQFNNKEIIKSDWIKIHIKEFGLDVGEVCFEYELPFDEVELIHN